MKRLIAILVLVVFISGCMVGPDYSRPVTLADGGEKFVYGDGYDSSTNEGVGGPWWLGFGDELTAELVRQALENNYDLRAAAARVIQSEAIFAEVRGSQLPQVDYDFSRSRNKLSFNFGGTGRFSVLTTTYTHQISVSYIVDLFGKLKRQERAAWADLLGSEAAGLTLFNSIIANVVKARANIATLQRQLEITRANTYNWKRSLEIIERRYERGLIGPLDVRLARENLAASQGNEVIVALALAKERNGLDVLLGRRPGTTAEPALTLAELPDLASVPVGVPAGLLDRRPDVRAAEFALESASENIGVSVASLYPDLTLSGGLGRSGDVFDDLFLDETEIYSAIISLAQPIFRGGQLRARVEQSKGRYEELAADYARTVLVALREVEDALVSERMLKERLKAAEVRFAEASAAEKLAEQRYIRGVEQLITVLESQRRRRIAENELNLIKGQLWNGRVDLYLALGGDWSEGAQSM